jgi:cellulose biosynthesis protein BcsQ
MKRLDLILNGKGGVGKSFFAINFVQFLKDKGIAHVAIDSDNENSTLKRFHPDTRFLDLSNRRDLDGIFSALAKTNLVVVDYQAGAVEVTAPDLYRNKARDQFADCLLVQLPKNAARRKAVRQVCGQLRTRKLGAVQPDKDIGESHLYLSLA